jgi:hypothetical protein
VDQTDSDPNPKSRFETWVDQADSFPIRLRFKGWVDQTDSDPNHKSRFETWVDQADSFPIRLRFEGWVDQTDSDPDHKFRFETWVDQADSFPIGSLDSSQVRSPLNLFGLRFQTVEITRFAAWVVPKSDHPSTCLD